MNETKDVWIQLGDRSTKKCQLLLSGPSPWKIRLLGAGANETEYEGEDLFEALGNLRRALEDSDRKLLCNGARYDVYPSGMSRSMGVGRKAYVTRLGMRATQDDIVDIFDYAEPDLISTVEEQERFHRKWVASVR